MIKQLLALFCGCVLLTSCSSKPHQGLRVAATPVPHAEMIEHIRQDLQNEGVHLSLIITEDYHMPNRALAAGEIDANFFQHLPFLEDQIQQFDYPIESLAQIEIEPLGIYSKKVHSLGALKDKSVVAIPNDPTNEARALLLLEQAGLIELNASLKSKATLMHVVKNPKNLTFIEVDPAMLPRTLEDADAAVINTNYALAANLNPLEDALLLESKQAPYANVVVIRCADKNREDIQLLKKWMTSEKMRLFIEKKYKGAIFPSF